MVNNLCLLLERRSGIRKLSGKICVSGTLSICPITRRCPRIFCCYAPAIPMGSVTLTRATWTAKRILSGVRYLEPFASKGYLGHVCQILMLRYF